MYMGYEEDGFMRIFFLSLILIMCFVFSTIIQGSTPSFDALFQEKTNIVINVLCQLYKKSNGIYAQKECGVWCYSDGTFDFWIEKKSNIKSICPINFPNPKKELIFSAHTHPLYLSSMPSRMDRIFVNKFRNQYGMLILNKIPMLILHPRDGVVCFNPLKPKKIEKYINGKEFRKIFKIWNLELCNYEYSFVDNSKHSSNNSTKSHFKKNGT